MLKSQCKQNKFHRRTIPQTNKLLNGKVSLNLKKFYASNPPYQQLAYNYFFSSSSYIRTQIGYLFEKRKSLEIKGDTYTYIN